jgi:hypothetical protein
MKKVSMYHTTRPKRAWWVRLETSLEHVKITCDRCQKSVSHVKKTGQIITGQKASRLRTRFVQSHLTCSDPNQLEMFAEY